MPGVITEDYANRFSGLGRLYGKAAMERLCSAHACVIGVGGVGSWTAEGLARSGVGRLTLIDLDDVCITNVNRQLPALDGQIGRPKTEALRERIRLINPDCEVTAIAEFFTASSADRLLTNKALLIAKCVQHGRPCVTVGGAGGKRDCTRIRRGDLGEAIGDDLLRLVRKKMRREHGFAHGEGVHFGVRCIYSAERPVFPWGDGSCQTEPEPGSNLKLDCASGFGTAVHVTGSFGLAAAGEALEVILGLAKR